MQKVGLTGGIASGKSSVARWFAERGITVFDADKTVHNLYTKEDVIDAITDAFGKDYLQKRSIDRLRLGRLVFKDKKAKEKLEKILHPYVLQEMKRGIEDAQKQGKKVIILDVPLLFETGWIHYVDKIWTVYTPLEIQIERLMTRNNFTREEAIERISSQLPMDYKVQRSDKIIDNSGDWNQTESQLMELWQELIPNKSYNLT